MAPGPQIKTEIQLEIQSAMRSAVAELGEMFKNVLSAQPTINTNLRPPLPPGRITASNDGSSKCNFCGVPGHFMRECEVTNEYMRLGKCKHNVEGKIVLPASAVIPRHITGTWLRDHIDEYHHQNPGQMAGSAAQMLLETTTVAPEVSLIREEKAVRFAEQDFDTGQPGILAYQRQFIPWSSAKNKAAPEGPRIVEVQDEGDKEAETLPRPTLGTALDKPKTTPREAVPAVVIPKEHPYARPTDTAQGNGPEALLPPPQKSERAYTTTANIWDEKVTQKVYKRMLDTEVKITQRELLSLSPEVHAKMADATVRHCLTRPNTPKIEERPTKSTEAHLPAAFSAARILLANTTVIEDPYETFLKSQADEQDNAIEVAAESNSLRAILPTVDGREKIKAILDPGCQIVAMSEEVCVALALPYDLKIHLNMVSANGGVDQLLSLARNVPFLVGDITLYLQVHILHSLAYDILLGWPFNILTQSVVRNYCDENQTITIHNLNTGKMVTVPTIQRSTYRFAEKCKVFKKPPAPVWIFEYRGFGPAPRRARNNFRLRPQYQRRLRRGLRTLAIDYYPERSRSHLHLLM